MKFGKIATIMHLCFILFGVGMCLLAAKYLRQNLLLVKYGVKVPAVVSDIKVSYSYSGSSRNKRSEAVFKFRTPEGENIWYNEDLGGSETMWEEGDEVMVYYNPRNPWAEVFVVYYWGMLRGVVISLCFGLPFLSIGLGYFLYRRAIRRFILQKLGREGLLQ